MTPGVLVAIVTLAWLIALIGLLRLVSAMDRIERLLSRPDAPGRSSEAVRRG